MDGLFSSKICYGLQLYGKVRKIILDTETEEMKSIQLIQNKMLRFINGMKLLDKISTKTLLERSKMLSVNQLNAQIKLVEVWNDRFQIEIYYGSYLAECILHVNVPR